MFTSHGPFALTQRSISSHMDSSPRCLAGASVDTFAGFVMTVGLVVWAGIMIGWWAIGDDGIGMGAVFGMVWGCVLGFAIFCCCPSLAVTEDQRHHSARSALAIDVAKLPLRTVAPDDVEMASTSAGSEQDCSDSTGASDVSGHPASAAGSCAICLEAFAEGDQQRTLPCFHVFHARCVDSWLGTSSFCPTCRHDIAVNDLSDN